MCGDTIAPAWCARPYETDDDLRSMQELLVAARGQTGDLRYPHLGDLAFDVFMLACHLDLGAHLRLWWNGTGLVGYALLGGDSLFDCRVSPEWAWKGIEEEALGWAAARLAELRRAAPERWSRPLSAWAWQGDTERRAFLAAHGFRHDGESVSLVYARSLAAPPPAVAVAPGFEIRAVAGPGEAATRAAAQREAWSSRPVGLVDGRDYERLMASPGYRRDLDVMVVDPSGRALAFAQGWLDAANHSGYLGPVGVSPDFRRRGLARAAIVECLRRMRTLEMKGVELSTGTRNLPARRLYESLGFEVAAQSLLWAT